MTRKKSGRRDFMMDLAMQRYDQGLARQRLKKKLGKPKRGMQGFQQGQKMKRLQKSQKLATQKKFRHIRKALGILPASAYRIK